MVTKGIITSIDFNGNTCQVRIPLFETAGNDPITGTAIVSNTPGSYNGYKVGDVVLVAFEDGKMQNPVIVGKLYLGAAKEKQDPRGTINVETTTASKSASLPADAVLTANVDSNVPNTNTPFGSLASIANNLNSLNTDVNQLDRFTRNQFNSVITDVNDQGEQLRSEIKQTASNIEANVVHKHQDGSQNALGWDLDEKEWKINAQDTVTNENGETNVKDINIVTITRDGMSIAGDLKLNGYPKNIIVRYAQNDSDTDYPYLYKFKQADFPGTEIDKTWYHDKYIKIIDADKEKYILISSENIDDYTITPGETVAYVYNLEEINPEWKTETPARVDGQYIWQWTHTESFSFNGDKWNEQDDDKVVCITGAQGEKGNTGIAITATKQWYILWPADAAATDKPSKPGSTEKPEPENPENTAAPKEWMSTPPEAVNGHVVWTCYESIFSDDTPENRHIEYSDPVKDNAYALAQGKNATYYDDTPPIYAKKIGDCWFDTGYVKIATTPTTKAGYLGKFIVLSDGTSVDNVIPVRAYDDDRTRYISSKVGPDYIVKITPDNINEINIKENTAAYETGNLKQWDGANWVDIAGELVTNKLTAKYINAMDITAKKITVLDKTSKNPIFIAGETGSNGKQMNIIGGFKIDENSISSNKTYANSRFNLAIKTNKYKYYQTNIPANDELKYVVAKIRFKKAQSRFILYTRSNSFTAEGADGSYGTLKNYVLSVTNNGSVRNLTLPLLLSDKNIVNSTAYRVSTDPTGENIGDWSKIPFNEYTAAIYHNLKENDCIYIVFVKNVIETDENTVAQAINGAFLIPEYQPDDPVIGDTTDDILEVDLAPASIPGIQNAVNTSYSRITDANKIFNIWEIDNKINYIYNNASSLQLGAKFSAYSDGEVYAKSGQLGPWDIANNRCNFNYFGTGEKNGVKYEEWYKQENAAWWDGDGITFTCKKETDNNWIQEHNGYHNMPKYTATTKISAANGITATNFYRLLYNNKERYKYTASKKGYELNKDAYWRRASLMTSISNDITISTSEGEKDVSGLAINAIATFKVKVPSKTGDPALSGSGWYTISGIDAYNNALDNIKPCCGICIRRALYTREINNKKYTDIVREVDCTGIKIWLIESNNKYIPNISVYYNKLAKINDTDTSYYNDEIDVIIFGTAMNFVNNSNA